LGGGTPPDIILNTPVLYNIRFVIVVVIVIVVVVVI
jgi:hypothetical protein